MVCGHAANSRTLPVLRPDCLKHSVFLSHCRGACGVCRKFRAFALARLLKLVLNDPWRADARRAVRKLLALHRSKQNKPSTRARIRRSPARSPALRARQASLAFESDHLVHIPHLVSCHGFSAHHAICRCRPGVHDNSDPPAVIAAGFMTAPSM
jgi:hypothetical protein